MPSFKPKNSKHIQVCSKAATTLDSKHKEIMERFKEYDEEIIPDLRRKRRRYQKQLNNYQGILDIEKHLELEDKIKELNQQIKQLKKEQQEYYLQNSKYVFDYFENKKQIAEGKNKTKLLNQFFNVEKQKQIQHAKKKDMNTLKHYLSNVDERFLDIDNFIVSTDVCQSCHQGELIPIDHEGMLVCNHCGVSTHYLVDSDKPSYKEPPKEVCFYAYKRINHFREILAQFQAKETTQIPDDVLENIKTQIKKERINLEQMTNKKAKDVLKKLGYNKYYEHIPFIKDKLGIRPPVMSQELEERLCNLFMDIQAPYAKYCPEDRVNFLNYYYTVYKLCELLDQRQFLPYFPMLKDREKRIEQDEIWKKICDELGWEFIPTV
jgi:hypothetical protein